nr:hypothetical protein [Tanacetum cinerariifolium]
MMVYLKNVAGFKMDYFKGMTYDDIRPVFEKHFDLNVVFLQKTKEQIEVEDSRALKRINETLAEKAAKRKKLNKEVEELKRHLQIVPNKDDDVYTEATLLARKVFVVDYEIYNQNNRPYFKIIRADGMHQLYIITFITTQLILLVERKYPLTKFTLDHMLNNVRLKVEEERKVSLELLSGEPIVELLRAFLNLGPAGNWLTLSNRGEVNVPGSITKPFTHIEEMDFRSFMKEGIDGEFHFLPREDIKNKGGDDAPSERYKVVLIDCSVSKKEKNRKDLRKNPLILDLHAEIETLQGQVEKLHDEYSRLILEEEKWVDYKHTFATLRSKVEEAIADPYAPLEVFLSKKPKSLLRNQISSLCLLRR